MNSNVTAGQARCSKSSNHARRLREGRSIIRLGECWRLRDMVGSFFWQRGDQSPRFVRSIPCFAWYPVRQRVHAVLEEEPVAVSRSSKLVGIVVVENGRVWPGILEEH